MIVFQNHQVTIFQSALYQTNSLVYHTPDFILLVDPNWLPQEVQNIRAFVNEKHAGKSIYLLFTHSDYDHIIGYGLFPEAKVIASERFHHKLDKDRVLQEIHSFDQQHYLNRNYPFTYPEVDFIIKEDGQVLEIGEERFHFYSAPGHTDDGLFTIIESAGIFIAGDYLSDLEFPFIYFDDGAYLKTLRKVDFILQNHMISLMLPGHGAFVQDNNQEILIRRDRDINYIEDLKSAILDGSQFPLEDWLSQFPFPEGLKEEHGKNEKQIKKDLSL